MWNYACSACGAFPAVERDLEIVPCPVSSVPGKINLPLVVHQEVWSYSLPFTTYGPFVWLSSAMTSSNSLSSSLLGPQPIPEPWFDWALFILVSSLGQMDHWINVLDTHNAPKLSLEIPLCALSAQPDKTPHRPAQPGSDSAPLPKLSGLVHQFYSWGRREPTTISIQLFLLHPQFNISCCNPLSPPHWGPTVLIMMVFNIFL